MRSSRLLPILLVTAFFVPRLILAQEISVLQKQLLLLIQQVTSLQAELTNLQKISSLPCYSLSRDLQLGSGGDEVQALQIALEKEGFEIGNEKAQKYFGEKTASAVVGYQQKYQAEILAPIGLKFGTGFVGKRTRDKLNSVYGCGAKAPDLSLSNPLIFAPQPIKITSPKANTIVTSTIVIQGSIESSEWLGLKSEGGKAELYDSSGRKLTETILKITTVSTTLPISFEGKLSAGTARTDRGILVISSLYPQSRHQPVRVPLQLSNVGKPVIRFSSPTTGTTWIAGSLAPVRWTGGGTKVDVLLIDGASESLGGASSIAWRVDDIANNGSYNIPLPTNLRGSYRVHVADGTNFGNSAYVQINPGGGGFSPGVLDIFGPATLGVNTKGTWRVTGLDPQAGSSLRFEVSWGDGSSGLAGVIANQGSGRYEAGFEHTYKKAALYPLRFTVISPDGRIGEKTSQVDVTSPSQPFITSVTPLSGPIGTSITLRGGKFSTNNTILFGSGQLTGVRSDDGTTLTFVNQQNQPGNYAIAVSNSGGESNDVSFQVIAPPTCSNTIGENQLVGCVWKFLGSTVPSSPEEGISGGSIISGPGMTVPVPTTADALNIDWGQNSPVNDFIGTDKYTARWRGRFTFDPGTYQFVMGSNEGMRVKLDGATQLDRWYTRPYTEDTFERTFFTRTSVLIEVEYFETGLSAKVRLGWTKIQ